MSLLSSEYSPYQIIEPASIASNHRGEAGAICLDLLPSLSGAGAPAAGALLNELAHTFAFNLVANFLVPRASAAARGGPLADAAGPITIATVLMPAALSPVRSTGPTLNPAVATAWAAMLAFDGALGAGAPAASLPGFWALYAALMLGTLGGIALALRARPVVERAWGAVYRRLFGRRD